MLQFRPLPAARSSEDPEDYWKLHHTQDEVRPVSTALNRFLVHLRESAIDDCEPCLHGEGVDNMAERAQRGVLLYQQYETNELRRFSATPELERLSRLSKYQLVMLLEQADDSVSLHAFFGGTFPTELRNRVYLHHLKSLPEVPALHHQPPTCLASRQFRNEALPIFYGSCTFTMVYPFNEGPTLPFLYQITQLNLAAMRYICFKDADSLRLDIAFSLSSEEHGVCKDSDSVVAPDSRSNSIPSTQAVRERRCSQRYQEDYTRSSRPLQTS